MNDMESMNNLNQHIDKTYILYVLDKLDITAYQLAKMTGINNQTFSRVKYFNARLTWNTITRVQSATNLEFKSPEHLLYSARFYDENPDLFITDNNGLTPEAIEPTDEFPFIIK